MIDTAIDSYDLMPVSVTAVVYDDIYVTNFGKEVLPEFWRRLIAYEYLEAFFTHCRSCRVKIDTNDPRTWAEEFPPNDQGATIGYPDFDHCDTVMPSIAFEKAVVDSEIA